MAKKIIMTVDGATGTTTIETFGFQGAACLKETADIERAIGRKVSDTKTAEFHQTAKAATTLKQ